MIQGFRFDNGQSQVMRAQPIQLYTATPPPDPSIPDAGASPNSGSVGLAPHLVLSPITPTGLPTTGAMLKWSAVAAGLGPATVPVGLDVVVWVRNPGTRRYGSMATISSMVIDQWWVTNDLDACEVYFQITAGVTVNGYVQFEMVEL